MSALFALAVGALSLRTRGVYFIMITLAFAQMVYYVAIGLDRYGGDDGMTIYKRSQFGDLINLSNKTAFYYLCLVLLLVLPFIDRNPERNPLRRPIATVAGIATIAAMAYLTIVGALAGSPTEIDQPAPPGLEKGQEVMASSGCLGCHKVGENGNTLGPNLSHIGDKLGKAAIARTLQNPTPPMPNYSRLQRDTPDQFNQLVDYVASLRSE